MYAWQGSLNASSGNLVVRERSVTSFLGVKKGRSDANRCLRPRLRVNAERTEQGTAKEPQLAASTGNGRERKRREQSFFLRAPNLRHRLKPRPTAWSDGDSYIPDDLTASVSVQNPLGAARTWEDEGTQQWLKAFPAGSSPGEKNGSHHHFQNTASFNAEFLHAGPRETIYFDPKKVRAAIVSCGGLCPGENDVIQAVVNKLSQYQVPNGNILGIRYGLRGLKHDSPVPPVILTPENVDGLYSLGGTVLGTAPGFHHVQSVIDGIQGYGINMLFVIGGLGGSRVASAIHQGCMDRGLACAVASIPKSIENDLVLLDRCFGFETAVFEAQRSIMAADVEARSALRGVGLVKLIGRQSGFLATEAVLACGGKVDMCLIPEVPFRVENVLAHVEKLIRTQGRAVIVLAEGAGQRAMHAEKAATEFSTEHHPDVDESGNVMLMDVGPWLKKKIKDHFKGTPLTPDIKYFDPRNMIRTVPAATIDKVYCRTLAASAVHGAFAGYSGFTAGLCNMHHVWIPTHILARRTRTVDPKGHLYRVMRDFINMPSHFDRPICRAAPAPPLDAAAAEAGGAVGPAAAAASASSAAGSALPAVTGGSATAATSSSPAR